MKPVRKWVVGIDEVGRGALAGPVVVAAAMIPRGTTFKNKNLGTLKDSKKLTPAKREAWASHFKSRSDVQFVFARIYPGGIEKLNISGAANKAALKAFNRLIKTHKLLIEPQVFLDGGLFLGSRAKQAKQQNNAKTIIKGDEKIAAVAVASIVAKVHRDRYMKRLSKRHPQYGFEVHKGYGTKAHLGAVKKYGLCPAHRLTFLRSRATI
jgi:ribonuclease HII